MLKLPKVKSQRLALAGGLVALGAAWVLLYDAFEGRGRRAPFPIRLITPPW